MRCEAFYEKWKKDPNWCNKTKSAVNDIDNHLELVDLCEKEFGIDTASAMADFSERASRPIRREKDQNVQTRAIKKVAQRLRDGKKVTTKDAQQIIKEARLELQKEKDLVQSIASEVNAVNWYIGDYFDLNLDDAFPDLKDVDLILTDPPYNTNLDTSDWNQLGEFAANVLVEGGTSLLIVAMFSW